MHTPGVEQFIGWVSCLIVLLTGGVAVGGELMSERDSGAMLSDDSLVGHWRMEGNLADSKGKKSGVLHGDTVHFVEGPIGGNALALDEKQWVIVKEADYLDLPQTTVELSFKLLSKPPHNSCLVAKRSEKVTRFSIHVARDLSQIHVWNGRSVISTDVPVQLLEVGQWYHLAVTAGENSLRVYLDGVLCGQFAGASFNFSAAGLPLLVGAATPGGFEQYVGAIDDLAIYSRQLSEKEIVRHVEAIGWGDRRAALLKRKEAILEERLARERERGRRKMEELTERMADPQLLARGETRVYEDEHLEAISFPLGGIGAGCIQINGNGQLAIWQIFNNFQGAFVPHSFLAVRAKPASGPPVVRALQTTSVGPFSKMGGLTFRGEYPFACYDFEDESLPVNVSMEAFTPLIPLNVRDSAIPCATFTLTARNPSEKRVEVSLLAAQQNAVGFDGLGTIEGRRYSGYGGNVNRVVREKGMTLLHLTSHREKDSPAYGDLALAALEEEVTARPAVETLETLLDDLSDDGRLSGAEEAGPSSSGETLDASLAVSFTLEPGESRSVHFVLAWYFPNGRHGTGKWGGEGNMYANWWPSATEVVREVGERLEELSRLTRLYHNALYASNVPQWLLDRLSSQVAVLRSKTCFWTREGYFGGWEGCCPGRGCCHGNCGHVWHYAQAHARLFPSIGRRMREESLAYQTEDGKIPFRQPEGAAAIDGQCGEVLEAYREHLCSVDGRWLDKHWTRIRKAMEYVVARWDADEDGVLAGAQHNTLDCEVGGSTSWLGSLYLAALEASERMAEIQGEKPLAARYRRIRTSGARKQDEALWNGEYYVQVPDPQPQRDYNDGCHIDQVLGEWWANQVGLEPHYPRERVRQALQSLLKYNFQTDFHGIAQRPRKFVGDDDAGMQMITWPRGERPQNHTIYADEAMTGFEYAAAATMIQYGLLNEGLIVTKAISDRYDGRLRTGLTATDYSSWGYSGNPFGDDECGKFYARAMSVWSVLLACQGFLYDGPGAVIGFKPVWQPEDHASFFTAAQGWGIFTQQRQGNRQIERIDVKYGSLRIKTLVFKLPGAEKLKNVAVTLAGRKLRAKAEQEGNQITIVAAQDIVVSAGEAIEVNMEFGERGRK